MSEKNIPKVGELLTAQAARDAIHIAIAPVTAGEELFPGQPVSLRKGEVAHAGGNPVGIVDPYLPHVALKKGDRFYLFLYQGSITSLRHEWTHPAFKTAADPKIAAEAWLRKFAKDYELPYGDVIEGGRNYLFNDTFGKYGALRDAVQAVGAQAYWTNFAIVTGLEVSDDIREADFYSCGC